MRMLYVMTAAFMLFAATASANTPFCTSNSGGYCGYTGKVSKIYINSGNLILLYFDAPIDVSAATVAGFTITHGEAAAFLVDSNPEFAKLFYSTALAAHVSGRNISIQMRGVQSGYLKFDRIWLSQ